MNRWLVGLALGAAALTGSATMAHAWCDISLGGMCSTDFSDGKGGGFPGDWGQSCTINAQVDQRDSMEEAAADLYAILDANCRSTCCYIYNYSGGDVVLGYVLENESMDGICIGYTVTAGGAGGGSPLAGDIAAALTCSYSDWMTVNNARSINYNQTVTTVYRVGGYKNLVESSAACVVGSTLNFLTFGLVPDHCLVDDDNDGAVEFHSSGGYCSAGDYDLLWDGGECHWNGHDPWPAFGVGDPGDNLNHYEIKMYGICLDGGVASSGGPDGSSWYDCYTWARDRA